MSIQLVIFGDSLFSSIATANISNGRVCYVVKWIISRPVSSPASDKPIIICNISVADTIESPTRTLIRPGATFTKKDYLNQHCVRVYISNVSDTKLRDVIHHPWPNGSGILARPQCDSGIQFNSGINSYIQYN